MVDSAVNLSIGTELDFSGLERDLAALKNQKFELNIDPNKMGRMFREANRQMSLKPRVDLSELHALNRLLDVKVAHAKQVQRYFNANPLRVRTDAKSEQFVKSFAAVKSGTITVRDQRGTQPGSTIEKTLNALVAETRKNRPQKSGGMRSVIGSAATFPFKIAGDIVTAPFKAAGRVFDDAIRGFGEDLGRVLSEEFARAAVQQGAKKTKAGATRFNQSFVGDNQVYETLFAEILRSGNLQKAAKAAFARTNAAKEFSRIQKLGEIATIPVARPKERLKSIRSDKELEALFKKVTKEIDLEFPDTGRAEKGKLVLDRFFSQAQPKQITNEIVNPLIKEFQPLLKFIQGMQAYNTSIESQRIYEERKAGFPALKKGEKVVNMIGGAQFNQGQGGRRLAPMIQALFPDTRVLPVTNPDTDNGGRNPLENWMRGTIEKIGLGSDDIVNTMVNVFRQVSYALSPTGSSRAAAEAMANIRLAREQGSDASSVAYSLGSAEGIRLDQLARYLGIDTNIMAMGYPFLNLTQNTSKNFQSRQISGDPLTFAEKLGIGFKTDQYKIYQGGAFGVEAHAPQHLFKQIEFLQELADSIGVAPPNISPAKAALLVEVSNNLYELIGAAEQINSLVDTQDFDMTSPFKGFKYEATGQDIISKFLESSNFANSLLAENNPPEMKQLGQQFKDYYEPVKEKLFGWIESIGFELPENPEKNMAGIFKYIEWANNTNKFAAMLKGQNYEEMPGNIDWAKGGDIEAIRGRLPEISNASVPWLRQHRADFGDYGDSIVEAIEQLESLAKEYVSTNGNISDEFWKTVKTFAEPQQIPPELFDVLTKPLNTYDLPGEEEVRTLQVDVPEAFKKTQSAILAYNQLLESLTGDVLPEIKKLQAVARGMSGATALLSEQLVYKTDTDPEGLAKIASSQEVKAYEKLQGRYSPLMYKAVPGKAIVTERIQGKSLKEILDRIAQPAKDLMQELSVEEDEGKKKELKAKLKKEKKRFNKAAGILYEQVGELGRGMQEMGVAHKDLAAGNVFFTPEGITSIDLGNSVVDPTPQQKFDDMVTTIQRAIIDKAFFGLMNQFKVVKAIQKGYGKTPATMPLPRQIDPTLLSPENRGSTVPLGSKDPNFLEMYLGPLPQLSKVVEEATKSADKVEGKAGALAKKEQGKIAQAIEEKTSVIVGKVEDFIVGLFNNALMAVPGEGGTLDLNAPQIAQLKDINPQILALLAGKGLQQTAISGTRGARNLYGVAKGAEDAFLGLDPSGAAKMVKEAIAPLALTAAASQIPGAGLAVEGAVQVVETALGPLANVLGAEMIQAISGAIAETVGELPIIGSQLEAGLVQLIAEAVTAALAGSTGILASGAVGKGLQLAGSAAANAIAPGSEDQAKLLQGQANVAATKALKGFDRIIETLSSVQLPATVSAFPKMLPQVSTPKQLQAYLDQNLNEKGVRDVFKQLTGKTGTGMGRKALTGLIGGSFDQDPQKVQQAIAKVVDEGIKSGGAKVGVSRGAISPKTIEQLKKSVQQTNKFIKQFDESGAEIQAQVGDRLAVLANFLQNELSSVQSIKQNFDVSGKQGQQLRGVESQLEAKLKQIQERMKSVGIGEELVNGIVEGVQGNAGEASSAAQSMAQDVIDDTKDRFGIQSPSKVFIEIGRDIVAGLKEGTNIEPVLDNIRKNISASLAETSKEIEKLKQKQAVRRDNLSSPLTAGMAPQKVAAMQRVFNVTEQRIASLQGKYQELVQVSQEFNKYENTLDAMAPDDLEASLDSVKEKLKSVAKEVFNIQSGAGFFGGKAGSQQALSEILGQQWMGSMLAPGRQTATKNRQAMQDQLDKLMRQRDVRRSAIGQAVNRGAGKEELDAMKANLRSTLQEIQKLRNGIGAIDEVIQKLNEFDDARNNLSLEEFEQQLPQLVQRAQELAAALDEVNGVQQELGAESEKTKTKLEQFTNALLQLFKGGDIIGGLKQIAGAIFEVGDAGEKSFGEIFSEVGDRFGFDNVKAAFKDLGESVAGVFASAFNDTPIGEGLSAALQRLAGSVTAGIARVTARVTEALPGIVRAFTGVFNRVGAVASQSLENIANNFGGFTRNVVTAIASFVGLKLLLRPLYALGRASFDTALEVEQLTRSLNFSTAEGGVATLEKIRQKTNELSVSFTEAAQGYALLAASTFGTNLEGQTDNIFEGVATAISARGLSNQNQQRAFLAISQIASKGKVSLEELSMQLSEALPGALQTAARALGLTTAELTRMVSNGEVLAEDFLPKFAAQISLEASSSVAAAAGTASAQLTKMNNNLEQIRATIGQGILDGLRVVLPTINSALGFLSENIETVMSVVTALVGLLSITFAKSALKLAGDLKLLDMVLAALNIDMAAVRAQMNATTPVSFNLGAAFTALGVKLKAFAIATKAKLLATLANIKAFFVGLPAAVAKAGAAVKAFRTVLTGLLLAAGKFAVLIIALSSLASVFQTANPEIVGMTQAFKALNKEIEKNNKLREEGQQGQEFGVGNDIESQTYSRPTWMLKAIPGWLGGGNKAVKEFTLLTRNLQKAQEEAISVLGNASRSFVGVSDEDVVRIKEIDKTLRQLRVESNIANEQGADTTGIKNTIRALTEERENIVKNVQGYGTLQGSVQQSNELIGAYRQLIESDARNADYYRSKIRELEDAMAPATAQLQDYADATNSVTVNIRKLSAEMQGVLNRISQLRSDAERTATTDQVDLLRQRLSGKLSGTEFSLGQVQITQESTKTIAEGLEKELANAKKIAREFYQEIPAELRRAFNAVGIDGGIENILNKATGELVDQAQTKFATAGGDLDATGEAALKALREYVQIRDETLNTQRNLLEQDLDARQQLADAVQQGIDRIRGRLDFEEEQSSLGNAIAENMAIAGRALSDFEKQVLQTGNSINQLITEAENFDEVAEQNRKAAMQGGLLPEDKARFERDAQRNSLLAENARAQAAATAADLERSKAIYELDRATEIATRSNDQWYQAQVNGAQAAILSAAGTEKFAGELVRTQAYLFKANEDYTRRRLEIKDQEIERTQALFAQGIYDEQTYTDKIQQLYADRTAIYADEIKRLLAFEDVREQIVEAQVKGLERIAQATNVYSDALSKQGELLQVQSRLQKLSGETIVRKGEQAIAILEEQKRLQEAASGENGTPISEDDQKRLDFLRREYGIIGAINNIDEEIKNRQLEIAKAKAETLRQEQETQRKLLALEIERNKIAAQTAIKEAEIAAIRARNAVIAAKVDVGAAATPEEFLQAQLALQLAQEEFGFALAQLDINKQNAVINNRLAELEKQALVGEQSAAVDTERFGFAQMFGGKSNPFRELGKDGFGFGLDGDVQKLADLGEALKSITDFSKYDQLIEQLDQARRPIEERIATEQTVANSVYKLSGGVETLNQKIENLVNAVGRPNITINGSASMAETIQLMREANR